MAHHCLLTFRLILIPRNLSTVNINIEAPHSGIDKNTMINGIPDGLDPLFNPIDKARLSPSFKRIQANITVNNLCRAVTIPENARTVQIAKQALKTVGIEAETTFITGFTDASIYNNMGIEMAVVGIGAQLEHSLEEHIYVADMEKALAMLVEILRLSAQ